MLPDKCRGQGCRTQERTLGELAQGQDPAAAAAAGGSAAGSAAA